MAPPTTIPLHVLLVGRGTLNPGNVRLIEAFAARGARARPVTPGGVSVAAAASPGDALAVLLRLPSGTAPQDVARLAALSLGAGAGWRWVDDPAALPAVHDKAWASARLARAGLPVPPTACVSRDEHGDVEGLPGERFVVKPRQGSSGRGVTVGLDRATALERARAFAEVSGPALVQSLLGDGIDHRAFVVAGRVVAGLRREPLAADGRGNAHRGARLAEWTPDARAAELALRAAACLGLTIAGVDLLFHEGRPHVLEVNSCPGFEGIERATGRDVAGAVAEHVLRAAPGADGDAR